MVFLEGVVAAETISLSRNHLNSLDQSKTVKIAIGSFISGLDKGNHCGRHITGEGHHQHLKSWVEPGCQIGECWGCIACNPRLVDHLAVRCWIGGFYVCLPPGFSPGQGPNAIQSTHDI
jgi:hypothetical protein